MSSASLAGCSILICEDEPLIALDIADAFSNAGARVVMANSLAQAFIAVEDDPPSAVILDHALSDGESSQLRECLKERNIPFVLYSGYPGVQDEAADKAVSLSKPASPQLLVTTVVGLLRSRQIVHWAPPSHGGGAPLVQIIHVKMAAPVPSNPNYVLVQSMAGGKFTAQGSVINSHSLAYFNPSPFSCLDEAIASAKSWAEENKVTVIYVKVWA
jgi:CheY-like chemotaxis protein